VAELAVNYPQNLSEKFVRSIDKLFQVCYNKGTKAKEIKVMKIAADYVVEVRCPQTGGEWVKTSIWSHECVIDEDAAGRIKVRRYEDFSQLYADCEADQIRNAEAYIGLFKKPKIKINNVTQLSTIWLSQSNFSWLEVRGTLIARPDWSLTYLAQELPAADFVELCQANGWEVKIRG
jgi:hypothetical protein